MKTKTFWVCHHSSLDIHSAWPFNTQYWKRKWKVADTILTSSKLHQWHPRIFEIWIGREWSSRWKNLRTTRWKPSKNIPRCNLRPQTVTFFSGQRSHGAIATAVTSDPLVWRFHWFHGLMLQFFLKNVYDVLLYIEVSRYMKLNLEDMIDVVDDSGCRCSEHPSTFSHGQSHSLQLRLELC